MTSENEVLDTLVPLVMSAVEKFDSFAQSGFSKDRPKQLINLSIIMT
jgi:hypothetical protein